MIAGIGTDRVVIARIQQSLQRFGTRFVQRLYTEKEYQHACQKKNTARRLAMMFAAKEAAVKALGTGFIRDIHAKSIEVDYLPSGQPVLHLHAGAAQEAHKQGIARLHLSLTDDGGVATAFVVAEKDIL